MGVPLEGPAAVQIWGIADGPSAASPAAAPAAGGSAGDTDGASARDTAGGAAACMELGLAHEGGLVWDLKWRPGGSGGGGGSSGGSGGGCLDGTQLPGYARRRT